MNPELSIDMKVETEVKRLIFIVIIYHGCEFDFLRRKRFDKVIKIEIQMQ